MIRVFIDVWNGAARSGVVVPARSLRQAATMAAAVHPNADIRVKLSIDAKAFFVGNPAAGEEMVSVEQAAERA